MATYHVFVQLPRAAVTAEQSDLDLRRSRTPTTAPGRDLRAPSSGARSDDRGRNRPRLGRAARWIPWLFVGFFVVVIAVNGVMIWFALESWTGLVEQPRPTIRACAYNRNLEAARRQAELGWQPRLAAIWPATGAAVAGAAPWPTRMGRPLADATVEARLRAADQRGRGLHGRADADRPGHLPRRIRAAAGRASGTLHVTHPPRRRSVRARAAADAALSMAAAWPRGA